jgi:DNA-binding transcriptional MocR family regulator
MESVRTRLARAMALTIKRLKPLGIRPWVEPRGGMFLWAQLPEGLDAAEISQQALAERVILAPGNVFSAAQSAASFMRFNVAQCTDERVFTTLAQVMTRP